MTSRSICLLMTTALLSAGCQREVRPLSAKEGGRPDGDAGDQGSSDLSPLSAGSPAVPMLLGSRSASFHPQRLRSILQRCPGDGKWVRVAGCESRVYNESVDQPMLESTRQNARGATGNSRLTTRRRWHVNP